MATFCNRCGAGMLPDPTALVPALRCTSPVCGRLIPLPGAKAHVRGVTRAEVNRALRAARRQKIGREKRGSVRHPD